MLGRIRRRLARIVRGGPPTLEEYTMEQRRALWPPAKALQERHLRQCRVLESREKMLAFMPNAAACAEVGILYCDFSQQILDIARPRKLHLIDIASDAIDIARRRFASEMSEGRVEAHLGDSAQVLSGFPDESLDWIYIDGDHRYDAVRKDLEAARVKIKRDGIIALNDYIFFGTSDFGKYGVVEAVNEFCLQHDFEMIYFALQGRMYNDVALRRIG